MEVYDLSLIHISIIAPRYWDFRVFATKMAVGPSAAPMTAMDAASFISKKNPARNRVKKLSLIHI